MKNFVGVAQLDVGVDNWLKGVQVQTTSGNAQNATN